jgi:hypothetical protein
MVLIAPIPFKLNLSGATQEIFIADQTIINKAINAMDSLAPITLCHHDLFVQQMLEHYKPMLCQ